MRRKVTVALLASGVFLTSVPQLALADTSSALPKGFKTTPVLKSGNTADGDRLVYPAAGSPEIVSVLGVLEAGGQTALHQHPIPVYVYVLEGMLTVKTEGGEPRHYKGGEAFLESVNRWHQAFNPGDSQTKLLVVFLGEGGKPTTINKD